MIHGNSFSQDDKKIARDGEVIRVPHSMMDGTTVRQRAMIFLTNTEMANKTDAEVRRAAVQKRLGDAAVAGKTDEYIAACFDTLVTLGAPRGMHADAETARAEAADAHASYVAGIRDGWMPRPAQTMQAARPTQDADDSYRQYCQRIAGGWQE